MRIEHGQQVDAQTLLKLWAWLLESEDQGGTPRKGRDAAE
jgi:hypothetical protein